ncbi:MAG: 4Fe-4S binding protein [Fusobacteriaceae bacterium]|jgi:ferredoxin|nr:4Fe-4S binding protein [Fusobacteriaceae bacterium]
MHVIDKDACIGCGACEGTCPTGAIAATDDGKYGISDACVDCGACAGGCPVSAISAD